jgi:large subunit ribosomal protein L9
MGDVVDVKPGYARNFLLPQGKARSASKENIANFETQKAQLEARNLETKKEAEDLAARLDGQQFVVLRSASDAGALYGSVTPRDPIKELGLHEMLVRLHPEVSATIVLNVARSVEEAELQASGKSIQELAAEEEAAAEFEIAELFDDIGGAAAEDEFDSAAPAAPAAEEDSNQDG